MRRPHPYLADRDEPEIQMFWDISSPPAVRALPGGYLLRQVRPDEKQAYEALFNLAWPESDMFEDIYESSLDEGFFAVEHLASGLLVSSCSAGKPGIWSEHPDTGYLGWLVTDPTHEGKGLATVVTVAVMNRLADGGYKTVYLSTEDERLAAIHIYLTLGWRPLIYADGMQERWRRIYDALGVTAEG